MINIKMSEKTNMLVDMQGVITRQEERVAAYKMAGKSNETIATIFDVSVDCINKQSRAVYRNAGVAGSDNPLVSLIHKSLLNNWIVFRHAVSADDLLNAK